MIDKYENLGRSVSQFNNDPSVENADTLNLAILSVFGELEELKRSCSKLIAEAGETKHFKFYGMVKRQSLVKQKEAIQTLREHGLLKDEFIRDYEYPMIRRKKED